MRKIKIIVLFLLLAGCSSFSSVQDKGGAKGTLHYYTLEIDRGEQGLVKPGSKSIRIAPVRVTSKFSGRTLVFQSGEKEYAPQFSHEFVTSPKHIVQTQLKNWLRKTGFFRHVGTAADAPTDLVLETTITQLYGDVRPEYTPAAVLEVSFLVRDPNNLEKPLSDAGFLLYVDVAEKSPKAIVAGMRQALMRSFIALEGSLSPFSTP